MGFREIIDALVPSWVTEGEGGLKQLTIATMVDASLERVRQGLEQRFPSRAGASGLSLIGQDRGIIRGRTEAADHYAERLKRWRWPRGHRTRGTAYALLEQVSEYFGGVVAHIRTRRGRVYRRTAAGVESWYQASPWAWDTNNNWGRFWILVDPTGSGVGVQSTYFSVNVGTLGLSGFSFDDVIAMRGLMGGMHPWKPAGVRGEWLVFGDPNAAVPSTSWAHWSVTSGGVQSAARYAGWRYISLSPATNNVYSGDPNNFASTSFLVGSMVGLTGDPTLFPTSVTLPNGSSYSGNPDNFPAVVQLLDDGDTV